MSRKLCTPKYVFTLWYNCFYGPLMSLIFKSIGVFTTAVGSSIVCTESIIFNNINYINPVYNTLKLIGSILPSIQSSPHPIYGCIKTSANGRGRHKSSGRHLGRYFASKGRASKQAVISPDTTCNEYNNSKKNPSSVYSSHVQAPSSKSSLALSTTSDYSSSFRSMCHVLFNAPSYVLTHQVISKDDTMSVSVLPPHAKPVLQPKHKELRSAGNNVGVNTSIALDSASSIHLFKDRSLLNNIKVDNKNNPKVRTTDSTFQVNDIGEICDTLKSLPLPSEGYYYYPKGVANKLSLALLAKTKRVVMDTAIENAFYVFNEDGSYIKFIPSINGIYCLNIRSDDNNEP
jgi:hypothetical protein